MNGIRRPGTTQQTGNSHLVSALSNLLPDKEGAKEGSIKLTIQKDADDDNAQKQDKAQRGKEEDYKDNDWKIYKVSGGRSVYLQTVECKPSEDAIRNRYGDGQYEIVALDLEDSEISKTRRTLNIGIVAVESTHGTQEIPKGLTRMPSLSQFSAGVGSIEEDYDDDEDILAKLSLEKLRIQNNQQERQNRPMDNALKWTEDLLKQNQAMVQTQNNKLSEYQEKIERVSEDKAETTKIMADRVIQETKEANQKLLEQEKEKFRILQAEADRLREQQRLADEKASRAEAELRMFREVAEKKLAEIELKFEKTYAESEISRKNSEAEAARKALEEAKNSKSANLVEIATIATPVINMFAKVLEGLADRSRSSSQSDDIRKILEEKDKEINRVIKEMRDEQKEKDFKAELRQAQEAARIAREEAAKELQQLKDSLRNKNPSDDITNTILIKMIDSTLSGSKDNGSDMTARLLDRLLDKEDRKAQAADPNAQVESALRLVERISSVQKAFEPPAKESKEEDSGPLDKLLPILTPVLSGIATKAMSGGQNNGQVQAQQMQGQQTSRSQQDEQSGYLSNLDDDYPEGVRVKTKQNDTRPSKEAKVDEIAEFLAKNPDVAARAIKLAAEKNPESAQKVVEELMH